MCFVIAPVLLALPHDWGAALIAAILGGGTVSAFISSQLNSRLLQRQTSREQISRALTEMLEIRHTLIALDEVSAALAEACGLPRAEMWAALSFVLPKLMPNINQVHRRL